MPFCISHRKYLRQLYVAPCFVLLVACVVEPTASDAQSLKTLPANTTPAKVAPAGPIAEHIDAQPVRTFEQWRAGFRKQALAAGIEPDLPCFAAITDEPEPEVAAAGHDRTIINIRPEHVDAWLNPDPNNLDALFAIFDDKRHPYYELVKAA